MEGKMNKVFSGLARIGILLILSFVSSCSLIPSSSKSDSNAQETIHALQAVTTMQAMEATNVSLKASLNAIQTQSAAQQPALPAPMVETEPTAIPQEPPAIPQVEPTALPAEDFDSWMKTASILLYEDMIGDPRVLRMVQESLDLMGLQYEDVGNAQGWLKERLNIGAAGGRPWDLIIVANELRSEVSGEYFTYLQQALDQNTSIIIESFYLDAISEGKARPIIKECGVKLKQYPGSYGSYMDLVVWPINGVMHPVLTEPFNYVPLTKGFYHWPPEDLGSLMDLTGEGDAVLLVGRKIDEPRRHGVVAVCLGGQLTLQTFSSHNYPRETMHQIWQNYIYNALKVRYSGKRAQ